MNTVATFGLPGERVSRELFVLLYTMGAVCQSGESGVRGQSDLDPGVYCIHGCICWRFGDLGITLPTSAWRRGYVWSEHLGAKA